MILACFSEYRFVLRVCILVPDFSPEWLFTLAKYQTNRLGNQCLREADRQTSQDSIGSWAFVFAEVCC